MSVWYCQTTLALKRRRKEKPQCNTLMVASSKSDSESKLQMNRRGQHLSGSIGSWSLVISVMYFHYHDYVVYCSQPVSFNTMVLLVR